jgi:hypothetical protein
MKYSLPSRIITSCQQPGCDHRQQQAHRREMVRNSYPGLRIRTIVVDPPFVSGVSPTEYLYQVRSTPHIGALWLQGRSAAQEY